MARNSLLVLNADVPLRNYTLTHSTRYVSEIGPGEFMLAYKLRNVSYAYSVFRKIRT